MKLKCGLIFENPQGVSAGIVEVTLRKQDIGRLFTKVSNLLYLLELNVFKADMSKFLKA